ncbi:MAG: nucleoside deaminase [Pseudomonadota bacterium]
MNSKALDHETYMREAIAVARGNPKAPFGTVLVDRNLDAIVARGCNQSHTNPTWHGEIAAINDYVRQDGKNWGELTLYTTAEPCCMCQGAILWSGITEVVFGTSIAELKRQGWRQIDIPSQQIVSRSWLPHLGIKAGVLSSECNELFRRAIEGR